MTLNPHLLQNPEIQFPDPSHWSGFVLELAKALDAVTASGTGTITSGTTSVVITHGLDEAPTLQQIAVTLGENPTNDPGNIWVDTITATQFTVNCRNDPGASNLDFAWHANTTL